MVAVSTAAVLITGCSSDMGRTAAVRLAHGGGGWKPEPFIERSHRGNRRVTTEGLNADQALVKVVMVMEQLAVECTGGLVSHGPKVGDAVEVANRFTGSWSRGFVVADVEPADVERTAIVGPTYRLRRMSDGHLLPITFSTDEVRADRERKVAPHAGAA